MRGSAAADTGVSEVAKANCCADRHPSSSIARDHFEAILHDYPYHIGTFTRHAVSRTARPSIARVVRSCRSKM